MLTFASLCSGIEAASVAWLPLGFRPLFLAEVDKFPSALLAHHYPDTPNLGDITSPTFLDRAAAFGRPDVLIAGTPCQAFSVAGLRKGLDDARGNLTLRFVEIANALNPRTILWENVPGVLSDNTNAFGCLLAALSGLPDPVRPPDKFKTAGYIAGPLRRVAWRILNAQHFGVPQRRRRVFLIASPGDGPCPAQILFESDRLLGNPPEGAETRKELARAITASTGGACGKEQQLTFVSADNQPLNPLIIGTIPTRNNGGDGGDFNFSGGLIVSPAGPPDPFAHLAVTAGDECQNLVLSPVANPITTASKYEGDASRGNCVLAFDSKREPNPSPISPTLRAMNHTDSHANSGGQIAVMIQPVADTLTRNPNTINGDKAGNKNGIINPVIVHWQQGGGEVEDQTSGALRADAEHNYQFLRQGVGVRRLTPRECERLQGFPDDYTRINDKTADGHRYKALGNSMAVPVIRWLGRRIQSHQTRNS